MTALQMFKAAFKGRTQRDVAAEHGLSPAYVNDILQGRRRMPVRILKTLPQGRAIFLQQMREEADKEWADA